ncbi:MAG: hemolysin III family protein [Actinomycetaceae bacterium]|nr:hemolysin III family protein [Actinomycetaceae bacterium]
METTSATQTISSHVTEQLKPLLRGWIHLLSAPLSFIAALVLLILAPTLPSRIASAVYLVCSMLLFGMSAAYHRINWTPRAEAVMRRIDHSNIFLLIAGTYTPICVASLPTRDATVCLSIVWGGAVIGIITAIFWIHAPRWFTTGIYILLGWVALWYLPQLWETAGPAIVVLLIVGGVLYTMGAVVYGLKRPDPAPHVFGFHEIFHTFTVLAWICHCVAAYLAVIGH